jgi:hypothetical protein
VSKVPKEYKTIHWKGTHFYSKPVSASFNRRKRIKIGDKIIRATTGEQINYRRNVSDE